MSDTLPERWRWVPPDELAAPESHSLGIGPFGSDLKRADYTDAGVPLVFVRNIRAEDFELDNQPHVSADKGTQLSAHRVLPGDVLITKMGDPPGDAAVYPARRPEGRMTADCIRLRVDTSKYVPRFVAFATIAPAVKSQILSATKGVAQKKVSLGRFRKVRYPVPDLAEQTAIVAAIETHFSRLDAAVASLTRAKANVKRARASVLKAAVEGRLVPTEAALARAEGRPAEGGYEPASVLLARILAEREAAHEAAQEGAKRRKKYKVPVEPETEGLGELPEGWCWSSLGHAFTVHVGATPSRRRPDYWAGPVSWVSSGEVQFCRIKRTAETITEEGLQRTSTKVHPVGTVLLAMIGQGRTRGQAAILDSPACNNQNCAAIRVSEAGCSPEYVYAWLELQYAETRRLGGGNNQKALNKSRVEAIPLPLPPLAEQHRIAAEVDRRLSVLDAIATTLDTNLARCDRLRQSILKRAFEGRLVSAPTPAPLLAADAQNPPPSGVAP